MNLKMDLLVAGLITHKEDYEILHCCKKDKNLFKPQIIEIMMLDVLDVFLVW